MEIAAAYQRMEHPAADHAKAVMQVAAACTGVPICDGSTNVLPVDDTDRVRVAWASRARLAYRQRRADGMLDEPATARALARFLCRTVDTGAAQAAEVSTLAGVTPAELTDLPAGRSTPTPKG